jgi:hypothetical protein
VNDVRPGNRTHQPGPTDAEIEAIVAEAIAAEAALARSEAAPPSSAIVWWRAQMRARQEAALAAGRPITIVHALAIAAGAGLMLSVAGYALAGVKLTAIYESLTSGAALATLNLSSRWVTLPITAMLVSALVATVAAYFIYADE